MALVKWEPLRDIEDMVDRYSRALGLSFPRGMEWSSNGEWSPRVDIRENDHEFVIQAELPGVQKQDVKVSLENGVLTIEGERQQRREEKGWRQHRIECSYGNFIRSFTLPANVQAEALKAHFHDGLLEVELPKTAEPASQAVSIAID